MLVKHAKTNNIADWTQADLNAQIALGNFPPGTVLNDITLHSDWNSSHTTTGTANSLAGYDSGGASQDVAIGSSLSLSGGTFDLNLTNANTWTAAQGISLSSANAFFVGPNGNTNPALRVVTNVASAATGLSITGNAVGSGVTLTVLSSVSTEALNLSGKGGAGVFIANTDNFYLSNPSRIYLDSGYYASIGASGNSPANINDIVFYTGTERARIGANSGATFSQTARTSGSASYLTITSPADTTLTASTESIGINLNASATRQFATGALTTQREMVIQAPTYGFVGASTITTASTLEITGPPIAGTNATITNPYALRIGSGNINIGAASVLVVNGTFSINTSVNNTDISFNPGLGNVTIITSTGMFRVNGSGGIGLINSAQLMWSNSTAPGTTPDSGLKRITAAVLGTTDATTGKGWLQNSAGRSRMTADATNATATMSNLTDMSQTLIAGRKYTGRMVVKCINSSATEGLQFDFNGGAATMTNFFVGAGILSSGGTDVIGTNISTSLAGVINFTTFTGESVVVFEISLVCNAAGTFIPRFAENTSTVGTATIRLGSYLWLEDSPN